MMFYPSPKRSIYLLFLFIIILSSCTSYSNRIGDMVGNVSTGNFEDALQAVNFELGVTSASQLPNQLSEDESLLLLERGTILQALGEYKLAARDFVIADQTLGWFDPRKMSSVQLGDYIYSANASEYRAPASERMMLNIQNMINFLVMNNQSGAKVEARRFEILSTYFLKNEEAFRPDMIALGNYLGGASFEKSKDLKKSAYMYGLAWHFGYREKELEKRLIDLFRVSGFPKFKINTALSGLDDFYIRAKDEGFLSPSQYIQKYKNDVLVLVQVGKVPSKQANAIDFESRDGKNVNSINVPDMVGEFTEHAFQLSNAGKLLETSFDADIGAEFMRAFLTYAPELYTAALSRAASRSAINNGADSLSGNHPLVGIGTLILGASMNENDQPDTRSWSSLASKIFVFRTSKISGKEFSINSGDKNETKKVRDNFSVLNFSRFR